VPLAFVEKGPTFSFYKNLCTTLISVHSRRFAASVGSDRRPFVQKQNKKNSRQSTKYLKLSEQSAETAQAAARMIADRFVRFHSRLNRLLDCLLATPALALVSLDDVVRHGSPLCAGHWHLVQNEY
jgi:hypothetical protein